MRLASQIYQGYNALMTIPIHASFLSFLSFSMSIHVPSTIYTFDPRDMSYPNDDNKDHPCLFKLSLGSLRVEWDAVVYNR